MLAVVFLAYFIFSGMVIVRCVLPCRSVVDRVWLGASLGFLCAMWMPALFAFAVDFTMKAQFFAMGAQLALTVVCIFFRDKKHSPKKMDRADVTLLRQMALVAVPLTVLSAYLQYTHFMRVDNAGGWHVGQSTYGDLPMHMAFASSLVNSPFPPEYSFYPGHQLSYPFLVDSLSSSLMIFGLPIQLSMTIPGTIMMALTYAGAMVLSREMTSGKKTVVLAVLLFFINGGLGFLYDFDQAAGYEADGTLTVAARLKNILQGYYKTPANQPEPNNLRWSNVICDMMIPQRTTMAGWCMAVPCFYLLYTSIKPGDDRGEGLAPVILLGIWAGLMPLIHTHSFAALALFSFGLLLYDLIHEKERWKIAKRYLIYGVLAVVVAAPQLVCFTFTQAFQPKGAEGAGLPFIKFQFNWANNPGGRGMRDFYLWFYVKNIGLPVLLLIMALFQKDSKTRRIFTGSLMIILAAEFIRFQPNEYDNNKLLYLAYLPCCMIVADFCRTLWHKLRGIRGRSVMAAGAAVVFFLSGSLSIAREVVSDYVAFSPSDVEAAEFVEENTPEHSTFITGTQHLNPVASIAGRNVVCGPDLWLYYHGFDTGERKQDLQRFFTAPSENMDVIGKYNADYIYVSSYETSAYDVNVSQLDSSFNLIFSSGSCRIYEISKG